MNTPQLIVFYDINQADADLLISAAQTKKITAQAIRYTNIESATICSSELMWAGVDFNRVEYIIVLDWAESIPAIPPANPDGSWSSWRDDFVVHVQQDSFLRSFLREAERRQVTVINSAVKMYDAFQRPALLETLAQANFPVIDFIATNDAHTVKEFLGRKAGLWRSCTGNAPWQHIDGSIADQMMMNQPRLITRVIDGKWLQVYGVRGRNIAIVGVSPPKTIYPQSLESYRFWEAADESHQLCQQITYVTGLEYFCLQGLFNEEIGFYIYDLEPAPLLAHLPAEIASLLSHRLVETLFEHPPPPSTLDPDHDYQRPTLFLRAMLQDLFDVERMRYRESELY